MLIRTLMVLTPSRYLNRFRSYYFFNIPMSRYFTNINHEDVCRQDSTVHYIFYDDVRLHDSSELVNHAEKIKYTIKCITSYGMDHVHQNLPLVHILCPCTSFCIKNAIKSHKSSFLLIDNHSNNLYNKFIMT